MPLLNKIIAYYDVKTNFRRGHDVCDNVSETDIEQDVITHVFNNIKYASSRLISEFISITSNGRKKQLPDSIPTIRIEEYKTTN